MSHYLDYSPIQTGVFPQSYSEARKRFLTLAENLPMGFYERRNYPCSGNTPQGEALFTDTLWLGDRDARHVLVLLTGTHGIEGFVGSAVACDHIHLLNTGQIQLPDSTALVLVHALTPWGYAWLRRCDEDGVDLNRNAVDFVRPLPENSGYEALRQALLGDQVMLMSACRDYERLHGRTALEKAVSGGQYVDATGPFYGGTKKAHGRQVSEDLIAYHALNQRMLAVIDVHSGLGAYGYGEIICDHPLGSAGIAVAQTWYGDAVTIPALGSSSSVPKIGLMDYLWHDIMDERSCHVTLEFGTYPTDQLFEVLLADHRIWARTDNAAERVRHGQWMRQHFCPADDAWRALVMFRARQVVAQALQGLVA